MRSIARVLLLTIALAMAAVVALTLLSGTRFESNPIESVAVVLGIFAGLTLAHRWFVPADAWMWNRQHKYWHWRLLGSLMALAGGGIGALAGRAITVLLR